MDHGRSVRQPGSHRFVVVAAVLALLGAMIPFAVVDAEQTCDIGVIDAAFTAANNNPSVAQRLSLTAGCFYTYDGPQTYPDLGEGSSALPELTGHLIVSGNNATINRADTAPAVRLISIGEGGFLELDSVTITGGDGSDGGGGIFNARGKLILTNSTVAQNSGTGLGGGVVSVGTTEIRSSIIEGNSGTIGGGVVNFGGSMTVESSAIYNNTSDTGPAGIFNVGPILGDGMLTLVNSSVVSNGDGAPGVGVENFGLFNSYNSTIAFNPGGGVVNGNVLGDTPTSSTLWNTIVAENGIADCDISQTSNGGIVDGSHNLDSDGTCGFSAEHHSLSNVDPQFVPGGPGAALAFPLPVEQILSTSPAVDAGDDAVCAAEPVNATDEIGTSRLQGPHCDIGAYEVFQPFVNVTNVTTSDGGGTVTLNASLSMACAPENEPCPPITPDGTWTFGVTDQAHNPIGTPVSRSFPSGVAQVPFSLPPLALGTYIITVNFQPDTGSILETTGTGTLTVTPGPPASLTLSPGDTSASVGQIVTEVVTVVDASNIPVADGTVLNYAVTGANPASGSVTTLNGQATISYRGTFSGRDNLIVTAPDGGQPSASATIDWSAPAATSRASVLAMRLQSPRLQAIVSTGTGGQASGSLTYAAGTVQLSQAQIESLVVEGSNATVFGSAQLRDGSTVSFRLEFTASRFRGGTADMRLSTGYDSGQIYVPILRISP